MSILWDSTAYAVNEDSGRVQLVLLREGFTVGNVSVKVMTVQGSASGKTGQTRRTCFHMHVYYINSVNWILFCIV